jgi:hypothetical protein
MKNPCTSPKVALTTSIEPLEARIAPAFATVLDLSTLTGPNGFQFHGGDPTDQFAASLSDAGDINGDGFADIIVGAFGAAANGVDSGASYVVFGKSGGFPADVYLFDLDGTTGFKIAGAAAGDGAGSVSAAGDINHDGFDDLVVGAFGADANGVDSGAAYVIFGHSGAFPAVLQLSSLIGPTGFKIKGEAAGDMLVAVSAAGDVNGDNIDDLLLGASGADPHGASYVVFGHAGAFAGTLELSSLNGANGFKINGESGLYLGSFGSVVSGAGDVNGDGFDDLIIGAPHASSSGNNSGVSYMIFGHGGAFPASFNASSLNGNNGFKLTGANEDDESGFSVSGAGDINADGFDDIVIGTGSDGGAYVVFGHAGAFPTSTRLSSLTGPAGFVIQTGPRDDEGPISVSGAGDVNGDGFDDLLIGDSNALILHDYDDNLGVSYVVYGHGGAFPGKVVLSSLDGKEGFQINGVESGSAVHGVGDVNGDGFDDLLIAGFNTSYVLFGPGFTPITPQISDHGRTATFIDADGDRVTVKTTRGSFDASNFAINAAPGGVTGGGHFGGFDLSDAEFAGANITVTAKRGPHGGDGLVNLGFLDATGIDLRKVKIDGDLGRIEAGDTDLETPALCALDVVSMGVFGVFTQFDIVQGIQTYIVGSIPKVNVATDLREIELSADNLGTVKIGGSIGVPYSDSARFTRISLIGDLAALSVEGDIELSSIYAGGDIGQIAAVGASGKFKFNDGIAVQGSILLSSIGAGGDLSRLFVGGSIKNSGIGVQGESSPADLLAAQTIGEIIVKGRMEFSSISAGSQSHPDVQVGRISVGANWIASSVSVGNIVNTGGILTIHPGGDPAILASIASIVIKGHVLGTVGRNDQFGFFAEKIVAFESGNAALPLTDGADTFNVGITFDTTVRDLV